MKQKFLILVVLACFSGCNDATKDKSGSVTSEDTVKTVSTDAHNTSVKEKALHDPDFIQGLTENPDPIELKDNYLIAGKDTAYFPEDLPLNKPVIFRGVKDNNFYELSVTRKNLTNLIYHFSLSDKNQKIIDKRAGEAILGSMFFLASETDEDESGEAYGSSEYLDKNNCSVSIKVGSGVDESGKLRATISYGCDESAKKGLSLVESSTLRSE